MVAQVALSLMLVVAAGLFVRTFRGSRTLPLGFDRDRVLVVNVNAPRSQVAGGPACAVRTAAAAAAGPGVADAAASVITPVSGSTWNTGRRAGRARTVRARSPRVINIVTPGWFATYGTRSSPVATSSPRHDGRQPSRWSTKRSCASSSAAATPSAPRRAISQRHVERRPPSIIVGVVEDAVYRNLREPIPTDDLPAVAQFDPPRFPLPQHPHQRPRAAGSPAAAHPSVAAALGGVDRDLAFSFRPLADQVDASLIQERLVAMLSGFFGGLALLLAGLGLYGVTAYAVSRRRAEIGIRMALGAAPGGVVRLVLKRVSALVAIGVARRRRQRVGLAIRGGAALRPRATRPGNTRRRGPAPWRRSAQSPAGFPLIGRAESIRSEVLRHVAC